MSDPARSGLPADWDITIVVPVWGRYGGRMLLEALETLRAQDAAAHIVVVDNASDEPLPGLGDAEVVRAPSRLSLGAARNLGLERVRTPFVMFWDADDLMLPGTLGFLRDRLVAHPSLVAAAASIMDDEPRVPHRWPRRWMRSLARFPRLFAFVHSIWSLFPTTGSTVMRTAAARGGGGFDDADSGDDWVLGVSLAFRGRIELHTRPGRIYRQTISSIWAEHHSQRHLLRHSAAVRRRLLRDAGVPRWAKLLVPVVAVLQVVAVVVARPVARLARSQRARHRAG